MVEYFNRKANISGNAPLGSFNVAFSFTGSKHLDATTTKTLCMDGYFIPLARLQLMNSPLVLQESVRRSVPASWDPSALARLEFLITFLSTREIFYVVDMLMTFRTAIVC